MKAKIAHIGFGWFGDLLKKENQLLPTPFDLHFFNRSEKEGCEKFELGEDLDTPLNLRSADILSISIPPGNDLQKYTDLCDEIKLHWNIQKPILFMSTTSVFPRTSDTFDESSSFKPDSDRGEVFLEIEKDILKTYPRALILRSGGQVGPGRHPLKSLIKNNRSFQENEPINFIHSKDLCSLTLFLFDKMGKGEKLPQILHAVSPEHPLKRDYYKIQAGLWNFPLPESKNDSQLNRVINSTYLNSLGFNFQNSDCLVEKF